MRPIPILAFYRVADTGEADMKLSRIAGCLDCAQAQNQKHWPGFHAKCRGCQVRALAHGPSYHASMQADALMPGYRNALRAMFGDDWRRAHEEVKAEYQRMKEME